VAEADIAAELELGEVAALPAEVLAAKSLVNSVRSSSASWSLSRPLRTSSSMSGALSCAEARLAQPRTAHRPRRREVVWKNMEVAEVWWVGVPRRRSPGPASVSGRCYDDVTAR